MDWHAVSLDAPWLQIGLFHFGQVSLTVGSLLKLAVLFVLLVLVAGRLSGWILGKLLNHTKMDAGQRTAIASLVHYTVLIVGATVILENVGIHLTAFALVASALGVGVGFGLQNIISNFISGLIIMLERPIEVGDRIELGGVEGVVQEIGVRRATVVTPDRVAILVPNQSFITGNVTNYVYLGRSVRLRVPVSVAGSSDIGAVRQALIEAAHKERHVLHDPQPAVQMTSLSAASVGLELQVWYDARACAKQEVLSTLYFAIADALRQRGIKLA
jgi:small-conductance mechanosensitive channel